MVGLVPQLSGNTLVQQHETLGFRCPSRSHDMRGAESVTVNTFLKVIGALICERSELRLFAVVVVTEFLFLQPRLCVFGASVSGGLFDVPALV